MTLPLNIEKYRRHVERFQMSEDQKTELLRVVWGIMENFIDRAFGVDSVQLSGATEDARRAGRERSVVESGQVSTPLKGLCAAFPSTGQERIDDA